MNEPNATQMMYSAAMTALMAANRWHYAAIRQALAERNVVWLVTSRPYVTYTQLAVPPADLPDTWVMFDLYLTPPNNN